MDTPSRSETFKGHLFVVPFDQSVQSVIAFYVHCRECFNGRRVGDMVRYSKLDVKCTSKYTTTIYLMIRLKFGANRSRLLQFRSVFSKNEIRIICLLLFLFYLIFISHAASASPRDLFCCGVVFNSDEMCILECPGKFNDPFSTTTTNHDGSLHLRRIW